MVSFLSEPRALALAARLVEAHPDFTAKDILQWIRRRFADGTAPRQIGSGYLADPQIGIEQSPIVLNKRSYAPTMVAPDSVDATNGRVDTLTVPVELIVLNSAYDDQRISALLDQASGILQQLSLIHI